MRTIEELVNQNRATIDQVDLPAGHRQRMEARLTEASRTHRRRATVLWISSFSAAAAVVALALWIIPTSSPTDFQQPLTAEQIEAIEVEEYYKMERDRAIDEVQAILNDNNSAAATQISYDLNELRLGFEADPLPMTLFDSNTEKYIALTIARFTAQTEVIQQLKVSISSITNI